ncbi:hypothetical protein SLS62_009561 [Diatrype stigma]|uniref:Methyltransferase domain-containing protein n=1 Tax=Diatrype stigma TaxID=117547 RepID=A0AAN9UFQ1_9PEZI
MAEQKDHWSSEASYKLLRDGGIMAYQNAASFVPKLAVKIMQWLDPQKDDVILDIGCGDGVLDLQIHEVLAQGSGRIHGTDASPAMIEAASKAAKDAGASKCTFEVNDALDLAHTPHLQGGTFTKAFSNAAMHWILRAPPARQAEFFAGVRGALAPGGTFAFEMGGLGNVAEMRAALLMAVARRVGLGRARECDPWFFPDEAWVADVLERSGAGGGWKIERVEREYRPTPADEGGVEGWVRLMGARFFEAVEDEVQREECVSEVVDVLEPENGGGNYEKTPEPNTQEIKLSPLGTHQKEKPLDDHIREHRSKTPEPHSVTYSSTSESSRPRRNSLPGVPSRKPGPPLAGALFDALEGSPSQGSERWFRDLRTKTHALLAPLQAGTFKRVKIAVLDTGIDLEQINLWDRDRVSCAAKGENPRIKKMKDFLDPDKTNNCRDLDGHGTHCIGVIRRVAPEADIYVARVAANRQEGPNVKAVIEAIEYAQSHWTVDIISLSFGFEAWITPLEDAIRAAINSSRTLVLAATSNYGTSAPMAFPANMPDVISLHAADHGGRAAGTNPAVVYGKNLTILGVDVVSAWISQPPPAPVPTLPPDLFTAATLKPDSLAELAEALATMVKSNAKATTNNDTAAAAAAATTTTTTDAISATTRAMTGTSVATPVAAGVAALVLEFAGQRDPGGDPETDRVLRTLGPFLRRQHGMHSVFRAMAVPTGANEFLNIVPWRVLRAESGAGGPGDGGDEDSEGLGRKVVAFELRGIVKNAFGQLVE